MGRSGQTIGIAGLPARGRSDPCITGERVLRYSGTRTVAGVLGDHGLDAVALALFAALASLSEGASTRPDAVSGVPFRHRCGRIWQPWLL